MKWMVVWMLLGGLMASVSAQDLEDLGEGTPEKRAAVSALQGKPAPEWMVKDWLNSEPLGPEGLRGKIVVVDFWATWCGPCIRSIPHNNELAAKYKDRGVVFVALCHPRGGETMKAVAEKHGIRYPTALDADGKTIAAYAVNSYPDYYLIDRKGVLRLADCANGSVEAAIERLLAEPAP